MKAILNTYITILLLIVFSFIAGCSTRIDTPSNRKLQNLSARFNYIYNSNIILKDYEDKLSQNYGASFEDILPVYLIPEENSTDNSQLKEIIAKAQAVISEKTFSNYLDEAYLLLGKVYYYQNFQFSAAEYFNYVYKAFPDVKGRKLNGLNWKARSEMQLGNDVTPIIKEIDSIIKLDKKIDAASHATIAQWYINHLKYKEAIVHLSAALKGKTLKQEKERWTYILAQLYEKTDDFKKSVKFYNKVARSNAPFNLYFNAHLNRVKLQSQLSPDSIDQQSLILALLKDDKNDDYVDQIFYKAAELYAENGDLINAEKYYKLSAQRSINNKYQQGLAYLRLAELNFSSKKDYLTSKLYFDSALTTLPKTYIGYSGIEKKSNSLGFLSVRFERITWQDNLQLLATLAENERLKKIEEWIGPEEKKIEVSENKGTDNSNQTTISSGSTFYFSNPTAMAIGFSDFKKKWGNRILEDNWRQSTKSSINQNNNVVDNKTETINPAVNLDREERIKYYLDNFPKNESDFQKSNEIIKNSLFEIAGFYFQELNEPKEAIKYYEELLRRFPNFAKRDAVYYSLYRSYEELDSVKVDFFKSKLLSEFPNSAYTKAVLDPLANFKESQVELKVQELYNSVYLNFEEKEYLEVIKKTDSIAVEFPNNQLKAQYDYLKAIAIGRTNKIDTLIEVFNTIIKTHPRDSIITPLVKDHLEYINKNIVDFKNRAFALNDFNLNDPRFLAQNTVIPIQNPQNVNQNTLAPSVVNVVKLDSMSNEIINQPKKETVKLNPLKVESVAVDKKTTIATLSGQISNTPNLPIKSEQKEAPIINDGTFNDSPSNIYYFVIRIDDPEITLSSSRFGIGQFNRSNFPNENLRHQLVELEADQLIFVGNFADLEQLKKYQLKIQPLMSSIMKIPANSYQTFIISKENFDKLDSRARILQYITFFSKNINE